MVERGFNPKTSNLKQVWHWWNVLYKRATTETNDGNSAQKHSTEGGEISTSINEAYAKT